MHIIVIIFVIIKFHAGESEIKHSEAESGGLMTSIPSAVNFCTFASRQARRLPKRRTQRRLAWPPRKDDEAIFDCTLVAAALLPC